MTRQPTNETPPGPEPVQLLRELGAFGRERDAGCEGEGREEAPPGVDASPARGEGGGGEQPVGEEEEAAQAETHLHGAQRACTRGAGNGLDETMDIIVEAGMDSRKCT